MKRHLLIYIFLLLFVFILMGCQPDISKRISGTQTLKQNQGPTSPYPAPSNLLNNAYPAMATSVLGDPNKISPPEPKEGLSSISGLLVQESTNHALNNLTLYLTKAVGEKKDVPKIITVPNLKAGDIEGVSDANGYVVINNIPPGDYYLIINYVTDWVIAQVSGQDTRPLLISLKGNQRLDLGRISVPDN